MFLPCIRGPAGLGGQSLLNILLANANIRTPRCLNVRNYQLPKAFFNRLASSHIAITREFLKVLFPRTKGTSDAIALAFSNNRNHAHVI